MIYLGRLYLSSELTTTRWRRSQAGSVRQVRSAEDFANSANKATRLALPAKGVDMSIEGYPFQFFLSSCTHMQNL